ncbi:MD-2-related lipid recognition domain-containing protein [Euphorbia peplus]|nr:MD-2-related lipid recognition domain-containing protein [Euphorbia peplus]
MEFLSRTLLHLSTIYLLFSSARAIDIKYCGQEENYRVKVDGVKISPEPVVTGNPTTFNLSASTGQYIGGGKVFILISYFSVPVFFENLDLCDKVSCPVSVGDFVLSHTQTLPTITPPGYYTLLARMSDEQGEVLSCISFHFHVYHQNSSSYV